MAKKKMTAEVETPTELDFVVVEKKSEKPTIGKLEIVKQITKQKQDILNLDSGKDEEIVVQQCNFIVPEFNADIHISQEQYNTVKLAAAQSLVQPVEKQADALLKFAANEVYANSKRDALAAGNYMSQELRSTLTKMLKQRPTFNEMNASEIFKRWVAGFSAGAERAKKYLEDAKVILAVQQGKDAAAEDEGF